MSIDRVRHGRQIRLPEIGEAGQERLSASEVVLQGEGDAREVEAAYLARSGVRVIDDAAAAAKASAKAGANGDAKIYADALASLSMRDTAARDVAEGALRALLAMRKLLAIEGDGGAA
jgi:hypothetical protein